MQKILFALLIALPAAVAFTTPVTSTNQRTAFSPCFGADNGEEGEKKSGGLFSGVSKMFKELDNFMDDASARRLGAGATYYGKRKSNFYGDEDKMKKETDGYDPVEDYRVTAGSNYKWMEDEDGVLRPVTRGKNKIMERTAYIEDPIE